MKFVLKSGKRQCEARNPYDDDDDDIDVSVGEGSNIYLSFACYSYF
jgi:hypothetical protein